MRYKTDIANRRRDFVTDLNGFTPALRKHRSKLPLQANFFPMPTYAFLDGEGGAPARPRVGNRFSVITCRPLGVASPNQGELQVMMERRLRQDDARGLFCGVVGGAAGPGRDCGRRRLLTLSAFVRVGQG